MYVGDQKLSVSSVSCSLILAKVGCMENFSVIQNIQISFFAFTPIKKYSKDEHIHRCMPSSNVQVLFIGCRPSKIVFHRRLSSINGHLPSKVIFRHRSSSIKGLLLSKVVLRQRSSSVKGCLPSKFVFFQRSYSAKGRLLPKVVFCQRSSSIEVVFLFWVIFILGF